ncbi:MAG: alpha/beta hydrolase [Aggregatilineales bacterium]
MKRGLRIAALIIVFAVLAALILIGFRLANPLGPMQEAVAVLETPPDGVSITDNGWWVFRPNGLQREIGFIFYPGGLVEPRSYAPFAAAIAAEGFPVFLVPMPLNLAVFDFERAGQVIAAHPEIELWAIGGHSLGGAMAARYAFNHPEVIRGLALWAAYPEEGADLSMRNDLQVVSIFASEDGLATLDKIEESRALLPPMTEFVLIDGGNHAGFGWYGEQDGDGVAAISREEQQAITVEATIAMLERLEP